MEQWKNCESNHFPAILKGSGAVCIGNAIGPGALLPMFSQHTGNTPELVYSILTIA